MLSPSNNRKRLRGALVLAPLCAVLAMSPLAIAGGDGHEGHAGDIFVGVEKGHIVTGLINETGVQDHVRTFGAEFGELGIPGFSDEPGWEAFPGTFAPDARVGWSALTGLRRWNGDGFDDMLDEFITVSFGGLSFDIGMTGDEGFDLAVQPDGGLHRHISFFLNHPTDVPQVGVYLVELELYATGAGPEHSEPFWIVFNNEAAELDHDAAIEWVEANLAGEDHGDHGHAGDIGVGVADGHIFTGMIHDGEVEGEVRTFESEFGESGVPGYTDEPGWEAFPGTFASDARVGWNALAGVRRWNGGGFDGSIEESITMGIATLSFEIGTEAVDGFDLPVEEDGAIHRHIGFTLNHPSDAPQVGVYLVELELYASEGGPEHSEPFWIVFNNGADEAVHEAAVDWVNVNLAGEEHCDADIDGDHLVNVMDLLQLISDWGSDGGPSDVNADGSVNVADLLLVIENWGDCH